MNTSLSLRKRSIEISRELTSKKGNTKTAKEWYNTAINSIENAAYISPLEFNRRIYNYLITELKNIN